MARGRHEEAQPWVIGKVLVRLADGTEELWMTQMHPPSDGPFWRGWLAIPEDAEVVEKVPVFRELAHFQEVRIDTRTIAESWSEQN